MLAAAVGDLIDLNQVQGDLGNRDSVRLRIPNKEMMEVDGYLEDT